MYDIMFILIAVDTVTVFLAATSFAINVIIISFGMCAKSYFLSVNPCTTLLIYFLKKVQPYLSVID